LDFLTLLGTVAPVFLVIAAGYAVFRVGWLSTEAESSLLRLVVNLLYPCLILNTVMTNAAVMKPENLVLPPLAGFATAAFGCLASYAVAPLFGLREPRVRRTFAFTTGIYNYGYIPLPVVGTLFGAGATTVLFIHNIGVEIALWTVGVVMLAGTSPRDAWRNIFTPPVIAIAVAVGLNFTGAAHRMPQFLLSAIRIVGAAGVPLALLLTGATFADQARNLKSGPSTAVALGSSLLRLGLLPLSLLALARWLPCSPELRQVIMVQAAMPSAMFPVILAKHYGGDPATALRIVLITSALGLITIPLWLKFGLVVIGH
jgi:predicted permease